MADRQWFAEGIGIFEEGEEEYFVEGIGIAEDQAPPVAATLPPLLDSNMLAGGFQTLSGGL